MSSKYAAVHDLETLTGPGDARPTALQIVEDNDLVGKWSNKVVLITGCSSGIGIETAKAMKATGAKVFATARDLKKGKEALGDEFFSGGNQAELLQLDLNSLDSVRKFVPDFLERSSNKLNVLINNAGIMALQDLTKTADGYEAQFGTNHLAHFLLFQMLKPTLLKSSSPEFQSRVVCVSSMGHRSSPVHFDDFNLEKSPDTYSPWVGYGQSKTANIYMANEIERRYGRSGIHGHSLHPGGIWTGLQKHADFSQYRGKPEVERTMKSPAQGAATTVWAAVDKEWEGKGGKYLDDCQLAKPATPDAPFEARGYADWIYDEDAAKKLWTESCRMVGVDED